MFAAGLLGDLSGASEAPSNEVNNGWEREVIAGDGEVLREPEQIHA